MLPEKIDIVYASTSGNVEIVCEHAADILQGHGYHTVLHRAEMTSVDVIIHGHVFILATSTWEHGAINPFFRKLRNDLGALDLSGKFAGFIGLGDSRYEPVLFCKGIDSLRGAFVGAQGKQIGETLKIDGEPYNRLDTDVTSWTNIFISELMHTNG